jgi:hypothetical protein
MLRQEKVSAVMTNRVQCWGSGHGLAPHVITQILDFTSSFAPLNGANTAPS